MSLGCGRDLMGHRSRKGPPISGPSLAKITGLTLIYRHKAHWKLYFRAQGVSSRLPLPQLPAPTSITSPFNLCDRWFNLDTILTLKSGFVGK